MTVVSCVREVVRTLFETRQVSTDSDNKVAVWCEGMKKRVGALYIIATQRGKQQASQNVA